MSEQASQMKQLRYYRPNKNGNGFASSFQLSFKPDNKYDPYQMFLVMAPQTGYDEKGNGAFDWENSKITIKLGENDLGELIAVLDGRKDFVGHDPNKGLYHQTPSGGNKGLKFQFVEGNYKLSVTAQDTNKKLTGPYFQTLSASDASLLSVLLKKAIERFYNW